MAIIGDYWDEHTVAEVVALLKDYEDLFSKSLTNMKGVVRELGKTKIELKLGTKQIKKRPYRMNPHNKE